MDFMLFNYIWETLFVPFLLIIHVCIYTYTLSIYMVEIIKINALSAFNF